VSDDSASIRRFAGWALVGGLSVAAAAAVLALLTGSFSDTDVRVILTSIGFAIASATASSGAAARLRPSLQDEPRAGSLAPRVGRAWSNRGWLALTGAERYGASAFGW
jgi:hypothetical protein